MLRTVLAIESSFDDTAVALVTSAKRVLAHVTAHQREHHESYGGVVPRIAAQIHRTRLPPFLGRCMEEAGITAGQIDAIAVTRGPGLAGCLTAGVDSARAIAAVLGCPIYGIHHMEAHLLASRFNAVIDFPFLSLLVSGGNTMIVLSRALRDHCILATTLDDSAGEALDKAAVALGIPWDPASGSPAAALERIARQNESPLLPLPKPLARWAAAGQLAFSFSGLKTAFAGMVKGRRNGDSSLSKQDQALLAASFQHAVFEHIADRLSRAIQQHSFTKIVCGGGVFKNEALRRR